MGSQKTEEDSELGIEVDTDQSMIAEITVTATGAAPITVSADSASPAEEEPTTLEPRLVVRGLGPPASALPPVPPTFAEVGVHRDSDVDLVDDAEEERTTQNIDASLHEVYDRAVKGSTSSPPLTQLSPIIVTPSEPIRLEVSRSVISSGSAPTLRHPAPIPAAGRPPEPAAWENEVTARGDPAEIEADELEELRRAHAPSDVYDEETKTNAMSSELIAVAESRARKETAPLVISEDPGIEPEETRTAKAPLTMSSPASFFDEPLPASVRDASTARLDQQAAAGGTVRMFFNPATGKATAHPDSDRHQRGGVPGTMPFGEQPTVQAMSVQPISGQTAPRMLVNKPPPTFVLPAKRKPRRTGIVFVFILACVLTGPTVYYRHELKAFIIAHSLATASAPTASGSASAAAPEASAADPGSAATAASAAPEPAASAAASASSRNQDPRKKRVPPKR